MLDFSGISNYQQFRLNINGKEIVKYNAFTENVLNVSDSDLERLENEWKIIHKANDEIYKKNKEIMLKMIKQLEDLFKSLGMKCYKYKKFGLTKTGVYKEFKALTDALQWKFPKFPDYPNPYSLKYKNEEYRSSGSTLVEKVKYIKEQIKRADNIANLKNKEYLLAASLASKYNISLDDPLLLEKVREANKEEFIQKEFPIGTAVHIKCCDECSTWYVGDHRCSCGNCRMYLDVDGSINNWYAWGQNG